MIKSKMHKIVMNKKRLEIKSADTDFYEFVDDSRLYYTFDRLLQEEDRQRFIDYVAAGEQGWFVVHMLALDGTRIPCYISLVEVMSSENIKVIIVDIERLMESEQVLYKRNKVNSAIHNLYGDDTFVYYPERDEVEIVSGTSVQKNHHVMSLGRLKEILEELAEDKSQVSEFIGGLRNGSRYLFIKANGSVKNAESEVKHSIIKCAGLYENGVYTMAVGYVHEYMERTYSDARKIEIDSLTGLLAKGEITNLAIRTIDLEKRENVSLAIVDIDHFKQVNDTYGHMEGDNIIRQVASIIADEVGDDGHVGRIGGDEFMILFYGAYDLESSRARLRSIKNMVSAKFPSEIPCQPAITLSIGCAAYPKDASNYEELFALADFALYRAKEKGRNRYIIYNKEIHGPLSDIKEAEHSKTRINSRGDMTLGEIMCVIMDKAFSGEEYPVEKILDDYLENFEISRITVLDRTAGKVLHMAGQKVPSNKVIAETEKYVHSEYWQKCYQNSETMINDIAEVAVFDEQAYQLMKKQGILSCYHILFTDRTGRECVLSLEAVNRKMVWNEEHAHYFRLMAKVLTEYKMK